MPHTNFILNLVGITDENIQIKSQFDCESLRLKTKHGIVNTQIIRATLTYRRIHCPQDGCSGTLIKYGFKEAKINLGIYKGHPTYLYLKKQRYRCNNCHQTCSAHTSVVAPNHTIANSMREMVTKLAKESLPVTTISKIVGVSCNSVERYLYKTIEGKSKQAPYRANILPKHLSVDEFKSVNKQYAFIAIDAATHKLLTIQDSRRKDVVCDYFENRYSLEERERVESIVIDLNASYQSFVHRLFPNAKIIIDRFHIIQLVNRAFDNARTSVLKVFDDKHSRIYKALKSNWRMFHKPRYKIDRQHPKYIFGINEYMTDQNLIDIGLGFDERLKSSYDTAHAIQEAVHNADTVALKSIIETYQRQGTAMDTSMTTLRKNLRSVLNSCNSPFSNGPIEGTIKKIKTLKRNCYGFRSMRNLKLRILLITK